MASTDRDTDSATDSAGSVPPRRPKRASARVSRHGVSLALVVAAAACGGRHVRLVSPDTTAGPRYTCEPGEGGVCQPAVVDVPAELNPSGTVFVILPRQCQGKIHQIVVLDADSSKPRVEATCAPREEPLEEMSRAEPHRSEPPSAEPHATGEVDAADVPIH